MMTTRRNRLLLAFLVAVLVVAPERVLGFVPSAKRCQQGVVLHASDDNRKQEDIAIMEELSRMGAAKIAAMNVTERTKRALLAEALEDRIFELQEQLHSLVADGAISEYRRDKAVQLAQQSKLLQQQYEQLVSGQPSALLGSLEEATRSDNKEA